MSCQSWWCGAGRQVALGDVPAGTRVVLECGCPVEPLEGSSSVVPIAFQAALCSEHQSSRPAVLPAGTPVQIDLLASLLRPER